MNIFEEIKKAGVEYSSWKSDLYFPKNKMTDEIVSRYEFKSKVTTFKDNVTGNTWYDVPFAYDPFWENIGR